MRSEEWDQRYTNQEMAWTADPNRFLVSEVEGMTPGRALDFACGYGRNAVWLAGQGWQVTGVDFSPVGIATARQMALEHGVAVEWEVADVVQWQPPAAIYNLVIIFYLQLSPVDRRAVLHNAVSGLAPDGTLLVVGHARRNLAEGYGGPPTADGLYSPENVAGDLPGLVIERADEVLRPVAVEGKTHTAIDALVRARLP